VATVPVGRRRLLVLFVITALVLLTFDQRGNRVLDGARTGFITVTAPLRTVARLAARPVANAWKGVTNYDHLKHENDELRDQVEAQEGAAIAAEAAIYENQQLKADVGLPTLTGISRVKAEVISGAPSNFDQTITINQGSRKGIKVGMPVITSGGLVGRTEQVTARQAVVRLLSDPESTVGVRFASRPCQAPATTSTTTTTTTTSSAGGAAVPASNKPGPVAAPTTAAHPVAATTTTAVPRQDTELGRVRGRGQGKPLEVEQVDAEACVAVGDGVITAGVTESLFPRGIPIGRVSTVERRPGSLDLLVRVQPVVDLQQLSIVEVLLYDGDAAFAGK
jgi:rod shape-determining protein MreC